MAQPLGIMEKSIKKDFYINLSLSAFLGALIWAFSPSITGQAEPWDAESAYYYIALFIAGIISALPGKEPAWAIYVGVILGQFLYILVFLPLGPLLILGLASMSLFAWLTLAGAAIMSRLLIHINSMRSEPNNPWQNEAKYLQCLNEERKMYAWCLTKYGDYSPEKAHQEANEFYEYEPKEDEYRGLVFHDNAWHWAMLKIYGEQYWIKHPEMANETEEYIREESRQHKEAPNRSLKHDRQSNEPPAT